MLFVQPTERHTGYVLFFSMCVLHLPACLPCDSRFLQRRHPVVAAGSGYTAAQATQDTTWLCTVTQHSTWLCTVTQHWSSRPCADRSDAHVPAVSARRTTTRARCAGTSCPRTRCGSQRQKARRRAPAGSPCRLHPAYSCAWPRAACLTSLCVPCISPVCSAAAVMPPPECGMFHLLCCVTSLKSLLLHA